MAFSLQIITVALLYPDIPCLCKQFRSRSVGFFRKCIGCNLKTLEGHKLLCRRSTDFPKLAIFASRPGAMINLDWLELLSMVPKVFEPLKFDCSIEDVKKSLKQRTLLANDTQGKSKQTKTNSTQVTNQRETKQSDSSSST